MKAVNPKTFGYIRVSTKEQNLDRQIDSLRQYVKDERDIYADKQSGKDFNRPAYMALKQALRSGDNLYVHEMERLGRNKKEIKENLEYFKEIGVTIRILNLPTTLIDYEMFDTKFQKVIMEMVNNVLIEVLSTLAETERETIRKRQREGIDAAHKRGKKFGRPLKELPEEWEQDCHLWEQGKVTAKSLMRKYGMSSSTFYLKVKTDMKRRGHIF